MSEKEIDRCEFWINANRLVRQSGVINSRGCRIQVNDDWDFEYLEDALDDYDDKEVIQFFKYGWPLNAEDTVPQQGIPPNQKSVDDNPEQVKRFINKELKRGSIIGPFVKNPFGPAARISPLGTRPKRDSDDLRIILNLSHPFAEGSVNHSINKDKFLGIQIKLRYPSVEDLAKIVIDKGPGSLIYKRDLEAAYYQMKIDAGDVHLLGFMVDNKFYFFVTLSMGSRSSCYCCQRTTDVITYLVSKQGSRCVNYLDDLGGAEVPDRAEWAFHLLGEVISRIGIIESSKKAVKPDVVVSFLGILVDSVTMTLRITPERLIEIRQLVEDWLGKEEASLNEFQSLLGKLNFACSTVRAGRVFVSRIINGLKEVNNPREPACISDELRKDLRWWRDFMASFDGVTLIPRFDWSRPDTIISTDSCLISCGGWNESRGEFWHLKFPDRLNNREDVNINEKETLAVMVGLKLWRDEIANSNVLMFCDNKCTVDIVNKGKSSNPFAQSLLREICYVTAHCNAWVKMVFRPGVDNRVADFCSRIDLDPGYLSKLREEVGDRDIKERFVYEGLLEIESPW